MGVFGRLLGRRNTQTRHVLDGEEKRSMALIDGMDTDRAMRWFSDFDLAVLRAAYPHGPANHEAADIVMLEQGLHTCTRKSRLLARLSCYHAWRGDALKAMEFAEKALLTARTIPEDDSDFVHCIVLLMELFHKAGHPKAAKRLLDIKPPFEESPEFQRHTAHLVQVLHDGPYHGRVSSAAKMIEMKRYEARHGQ